MDDKLQIVGICDSGLKWSREDAVLRFWNVDSALFTPLQHVTPRPAAGGLRSLGSMESGKLHCSGGHRNLGIVESENVLQIWSQIALWNLGILESAIR